MSIAEIENKTHSELKAGRDALVEQAKGEGVPVLAARYVKTLIVAKQRDEKLAEQGKTITALQDGLAAAKQQTETLQRQINQAVAELNVLRASAQEVALADKTAIGRLTESLREQTARADRLKVEATRNHGALSQVAKLANDALAARAVEQADKGD